MHVTHSSQQRVRVVDLELSLPLAAIRGLAGYTRLRCLLRWHGQPIGTLDLPVHGDHCPVTCLGKAIASEQGFALLKHLLRQALKSAAPHNGWDVSHLLKFRPEPPAERLPSISVAVCTRDRTADLANCLAALKSLEYAPLEILLIDNAPRTSLTRELVQKRFPDVRYILEPRPGLNWARNRAVSEARGEVIAFADDDTVPDPQWTARLAAVFAENPGVMCVTGLVVPHELETDAQLLFEEYGGFGRGFDRKWYRSAKGSSIGRIHGGTGKCGTGANMAYRTGVFPEIGVFDPALDVGTATQGGGDLDMFFRVLKHGHTLVYEPAAIVRHVHRRDMEKLQTQIRSNGIGFYSYLVRNAIFFPDEQHALMHLGAWWFWHWNIRRWLQSWIRPGKLPRSLIWGELTGSIIGLIRYHKARRELPEKPEKLAPKFLSVAAPGPEVKLLRCGCAVRAVDLSSGLLPLNDVTEYSCTQVYLTWRDCPLGELKIENDYQPISASQLADAAVEELGLRLLDPAGERTIDAIWAGALAELHERFLGHAEIESQPPTRLAPEVPVSVIVPTADRPEHLRACLRALSAQATERHVEIIVIDNHPDSNLTPPVASEFPGVKLISEPRKGLSYARNAGFNASTGDILIATDDDVTMPPDWLEKLIAPFTRNDVMLVCGNTLPLELETTSQMLFETYGGLGRGFERCEYDRDWFDSFGRRAVPTWEIGATANAAVRASALAHEEIGLLDEALGAGTPTGCSEDTYLFYKILKAGGTIVYEPAAYVWHRHRCDDAALRRQIYSYSKGHVAYHLTTLFLDHDLRALTRVCVELPVYNFKRTCKWLVGNRAYPFPLLAREIAGNLMGPIALWQSRRRANKLGRSVSLALRPTSIAQQAALPTAEEFAPVIVPTRELATAERSER